MSSSTSRTIGSGDVTGPAPRIDVAPQRSGMLAAQGPEAGGTEQSVEQVNQLRHGSMTVELDAAFRNYVLQLRGSQALTVLEAIQMWLDVAPETHKLRRDAIHLCVDLASRTRQLPSSYYVKGVNIDVSQTRAGGFGVVYRGLFDGKAVAVKQPQVHIDIDTSLTKFYREVVIWRQMKHQYILPLIGVDAQVLPHGPIHCIISPWAANTHLAAFIKSEAYDAGKDLYRLILEIAEALAYLHGQGVIHGDLKDLNILIDRGGHVQLADFGLSMMDDSPQGMHMATSFEKSGTVKWSSPECLEDARRSMENDVYAFACVCYMLFAGHEPFYDARSKFRIQVDVIGGKRPKRPQLSDEGCVMEPTDEMWSLIHHCWHQQAGLRPMMSGALKDLREICLPVSTSRGGQARPRTPNVVRAIVTAHDAVLELRGDTARALHQDSRLVESVETLGRILDDALRSDYLLEYMADLRDDDALKMMEVLQTWLDLSPVTDDFRSRAIDLLVRIAASSRQSSESLFIRGVVMDPEPFLTGPYADIFRGTYHDQPVALKRLRFAFSEASRGQLHVRRQVLVWRQLRHPFILPFVGIHNDETSPLVFVVSPWMSAGNLGDFIRTCEYKSEVPRLILEVAEALHFIHVQALVHGNLDDSNILISGEGRIQLAGFGRAVVAQGGEISDEPVLTNTTAGTAGAGMATACWLAPETLDEGYTRASAACDVYSFASLCYMIFCGWVPFRGMRQIRVMMMVMRGSRAPRPASYQEPTVEPSDEEWQLIQDCWASEPDARPSMKTVLQRLKQLHPYVPPALPVTPTCRKALSSEVISPAPVSEDKVRSILQLPSDEPPRVPPTILQDQASLADETTAIEEPLAGTARLKVRQNRTTAAEGSEQPDRSNQAARDETGSASGHTRSGCLSRLFCF